MHPWKKMTYGKKSKVNYNRLTDEQKKEYWDNLKKISEPTQENPNTLNPIGVHSINSN